MHFWMGLEMDPGMAGPHLHRRPWTHVPSAEAAGVLPPPWCLRRYLRRGARGATTGRWRRSTWGRRRVMPGEGGGSSRAWWCSVGVFFWYALWWFVAGCELVKLDGQLLLRMVIFHTHAPASTRLREVGFTGQYRTLATRGEPHRLQTSLQSCFWYAAYAILSVPFHHPWQARWSNYEALWHMIFLPTRPFGDGNSAADKEKSQELWRTCFFPVRMVKCSIHFDNNSGKKGAHGSAGQQHGAKRPESSCEALKYHNNLWRRLITCPAPFRHMAFVPGLPEAVPSKRAVWRRPTPSRPRRRCVRGRERPRGRGRLRRRRGRWSLWSGVVLDIIPSP